MENNLMKSNQKEIVTARQAQEVQAAMIVAKKFPRNELTSCESIRQSCLRKGLAEQAEYSYPRGGKRITGASIRLAETIAQKWGNIDYGLIELNREAGYSEMMAYAWDLESNTRRTIVFTALHVRERKDGNVNLKDPRDIYEMTANLGARRVRACILGIVPGDVVEKAVMDCRDTLKKSYTEPLKDRIKKMLAVFTDNFRVTHAMIENKFGYKLEALTENNFLELIAIHNSLKDGMSKREDWFFVKPIGKPVVEMPKSTDDIEMEEIEKATKKDSK